MKKPLFFAVAMTFWVGSIFYACNSTSETNQQDPIAAIHDKLEAYNSYMGTAECKSCHEAEYHDWKDSDHDLAMQEVNDSTVLGDFNDVTITLNGITSKLYRNGDDYMAHTIGEDGEYHEYKVAYVFGIRPLQNYLVYFPKGKLQVLRLTWDSEKNRWYNTNDHLELAHGEWINWAGGGANWNTMCAECHSTNVKKNYIADADSFHTTFDIIDVSCEACHGPGEKHVKWVNDPDYEKYKEKIQDNFVEQPTDMENITMVDKCAPCHIRRQQIAEFTHEGELMDHYIPEILRDNLYHADGQIKDEVYVYGSFVQSKMYHNGVKCADCHNVHSLKLKAEGNALCGSCHAPSVYNTEKHHFHKGGDKVKETQCVNCHMTGETYMGIDFRRDHSFRVPRPDQSAKFGTPNACTGCHTEKSDKWAAKQIEEWYGKERNYHFSDALTIGRERTQESVPELLKLLKDKSQPTIARATAVHYLSAIPNDDATKAIIRALNDPEPLIRYYAVEVVANYPEDQKMTYLVPRMDDKLRAVRVAAARALFGTEKKEISANYHKAYDRAMDEYERSLAINADFPGGQFNYGQFYTRRGELEKAEQAYLRAIEKDNLFHMARLNLSHLYNTMKKNDKAVAMLEEVIKGNPEYGPAYYSLGLLYAEEKQMDKAVAQLEKAAKYDSQNTRIYYNWGLILQGDNKRKEAMKVFKKGLEVAPEDIGLNNALMILYVQDQKLNEAKPHLDLLLKYYPNDQQLQNLRMQIYNQQ